MALTSGKKPVIQQGWLRVLLFFVAYVGCIALVGVLAGVAVLASGKAITKDAILLVIAGTTLLTALLVVVFRLFIDRRSLLSLGFPWRGREALIGFLLGPAILGIGSSILYLMDNLHWTDSLINPTDLLAGFAIMLLTAVGEELVFRGYVLNNLLESMEKWTALAISALLFAFIHAGNNGLHVVGLINLFVGGLLLGINFIYTRNLWFSIFFHFSWNFFQGPVLGYKVSGLDLQSVLQQELSGSTLLTGGDFGFEGSILDTTISVVALLLLWQAFEKRYRSA